MINKVKLIALIILYYLVIIVSCGDTSQSSKLYLRALIIKKFSPKIFLLHVVSHFIYSSTLSPQLLISWNFFTQSWHFYSSPPNYFLLMIDFVKSVGWNCNQGTSRARKRHKRGREYKCRPQKRTEIPFLNVEWKDNFFPLTFHSL